MGQNPKHRYRIDFEDCLGLAYLCGSLAYAYKNMASSLEAYQPSRQTMAAYMSDPFYFDYEAEYFEEHAHFFGSKWVAAQKKENEELNGSGQLPKSIIPFDFPQSANLKVIDFHFEAVVLFEFPAISLLHFDASPAEMGIDVMQPIYLLKHGGTIDALAFVCRAEIARSGQDDYVIAYDRIYRNFPTNPTELSFAHLMACLLPAEAARRRGRPSVETYDDQSDAVTDRALDILLATGNSDRGITDAARKAISEFPETAIIAKTPGAKLQRIRKMLSERFQAEKNLGPCWESEEEADKFDEYERAKLSGDTSTWEEWKERFPQSA
jgi:hypothetical protein